MPQPKNRLGTNPIAEDPKPTVHPLEVAERPQRAVRPRKTAVTVHISPEVLERVRDAVYWTPGLTLAELAERALIAEIEVLEVKRGEAFPKRNGELQTGRPVK